jgi:PAS domain S-box-containing protein
VANEAIAAGVTDYIQKGYDSKQYTLLANRLRKAVEATRQRERAEELERVNGLIRRVNRRVARARSAAEIERAVCETIAGATPYRFAWLGGRDPGSDTVQVRATGGDAADYLGGVEIRTDHTPAGRGPAGRALRTGRVQAAQAIREDPSFEPWHDRAKRFGFRSAVVLPLDGVEEDHGILTIYSDRRHAFDDHERTILEELAGTIAGALDGAGARQRLEERERELERYEGIVEASGDPVYVVDADGRFRFVNDRLVEMSGYSERELIGEAVSVVLPPDDVERGEELIRSLLATPEEQATYEMCIVTADGERVHCENHISLLPFEERFRGTVGIVRDIEQRKRRERELERKNERLEEFASVVSHDLRNPLNVVEGSLELAERKDDLSELDRARRGLEQMRNRIDDLLALAQAGEDVADLEALALEAVASDAWDAIDAPGTRLRVESDLTLQADEPQLRRLLENLFRNSVEHGATEEGVAVTVGPIEPGPDAEGGFYVADDGPGIPAERREAVFQRGHSTSETGTGYGLLIVKRIGAAHGWEVELTASATGGARFEFHEPDN